MVHVTYTNGLRVLKYTATFLYCPTVLKTLSLEKLSLCVPVKKRVWEKFSNCV
jgi:hypothetical protein